MRANLTCVRICLTVVNHLDIVTGTRLTDPVAAGLAVDLSSGFLENLLDVWPGGGRTTRHQRRTVASTLLTTRDTGTDEQETLGLELLGAADRVGVVRVTTVDDDVTLFKVRGELIDECIDSRASLDEEDDFAWRLELGDELLDGVGALDLCA